MTGIDGLANWLRVTLDRLEEQITNSGQLIAESWIAVEVSSARSEIVKVGSTVATDLLPRDAQHAAFWDPARVLRLVESTRKTLALVEATLATAFAYFTVESCDEDDAILAEQVLRQIAVPFDDQPGYRTEWAPPAS